MKRQGQYPTEFDLLKMFINEMERAGLNHKQVFFDIDASMAAQIGSKLGVDVSLEQIQRLADKCLANEWLKLNAMGSQYKNLSLTTAGFGVVRSRVCVDDALARRSHFKKISDYVEDHKGIFALLGALGAIATLLKVFLG